MSMLSIHEYPYIKLSGRQVKGSDVRPGVPLVSLGLRRFCVAGVGQCPLPRGRMYARASLWCPLVSAAWRGTMSIAKGSDVRPGVPVVSLGLRRFWVAGVRQRPLPRGRMYTLASLWCPLVSAAFSWQAWDNVHMPRGRMYALASLWCPL